MNDIKESVDIIPEGLENEYLTEKEELQLKKLIKSLFFYTILVVLTSLTSIILKFLEVEGSVTLISGTIAIVIIVFIVIRVTMIYKEVGNLGRK
jgi:polyferredoxin